MSKRIITLEEIVTAVSKHLHNYGQLAKLGNATKCQVITEKLAKQYGFVGVDAITMEKLFLLCNANVKNPPAVCNGHQHNITYDFMDCNPCKKKCEMCIDINAI